MKTIKLLALITVHCSLITGLRAATTINTGNNFAYGANIGWMDWRGELAGFLS